MVKVYSREGYRLKSAKGNAYIGQSLGKIPSVVLFPWIQDRVTFLVLICDSMHGVLPIRQARSPKDWCSESLLGFYQVGQKLAAHQEVRVGKPAKL